MTEQVMRLLGVLLDWADTGQERADGAGPGPSCSWCPVCQAAERLGRTSPETRAHLTAAATSLLSGVASLLEGIAEHQRATRGEPTDESSDASGPPQHPPATR